MRGLMLAGLMTGLCWMSACAEKSDPPPHTRVGGYTRASVTGMEVREAAEFAVNTHAEASRSVLVLKKIVAAQRQVVAGTNFKLTLDVKSDGQAKQAQAVVYRKLDGDMSLTSWDWK